MYQNSSRMNDTSISLKIEIFSPQGGPENPFDNIMNKDIYGLVSRTEYENGKKLQYADKL